MYTPSTRLNSTKQQEEKWEAFGPLAIAYVRELKCPRSNKKYHGVSDCKNVFEVYQFELNSVNLHKVDSGFISGLLSMHGLHHVVHQEDNVYT